MIGRKYDLHGLVQNIVIAKIIWAEREIMTKKKNQNEQSAPDSAATDHDAADAVPVDKIPKNSMIAKPAFAQSQYQIKIGPAKNSQIKSEGQRAAEKSVIEIIHEIKAFENELTQDEEAFMAIIGGPSGSAIFLNGIIPLGLDKVVFVGQNQKGEKARLIQHVSQINIMLQSMPIKPEIEPRRFGIGFHTSIEDDEEETDNMVVKAKKGKKTKSAK